jgi:membrane-bound lytic murein transglycosylase A
MQRNLGRPSFFAGLVLVIAIVVAWWLFTPSAPGPLRLTPAGFNDIPGWKGSDAKAALAAFKRSCAAMMAKPAAMAMGGAGYAGTIGDWRGVCADAKNATNARAFFETDFTPVEVGAGRVREGLFTGYYEPQLHGSLERHGKYQTPVYGLPPDLVSVDLGQFRDALKGERIAGRVIGQRLVPYDTRAAIDAHGAKAPVLFYADDPVSVFFLQVQGSGRVVLDNGAVMRVSYAGQNGHPYTAIGRTLIDRGALAREDVSLQTIRAWLKSHPGEARAVMETDASYVFFREEPVGDPKLGSTGTENVPLTPGASLAVDSRLHPLGVPFFIAGDQPDPGNRLLVAQDTGGAISGPVRGDVFWGFGQKAEDIAGAMKAVGKFYVLLPKPLAARLGSHKDFPS